jgi:hypothetical protein
MFLQQLIVSKSRRAQETDLGAAGFGVAETPRISQTRMTVMQKLE